MMNQSRQSLLGGLIMRLVNHTKRRVAVRTREAAAIDYTADIHILEAVGIAGKQPAVKNSWALGTMQR